MKSLLLTLLFVINLCYAQVSGSLKIQQGLEVSNEKVYIHFDKNSYQSGDTVWFKAYLISGINQTVASKNFYFELYSQKGRFLKRITSPILQSTAFGSAILPTDSSANGFYCRAYTLSMLKTDTEFIYKKYLPLYKKALNIINDNNVILRFFPEGGKLVANLPSVIGFKSTDSFERPVFVEGIIKDDQNNLITQFTTKHDGMGAFVLIPKTKRTYTAYYKIKNDTNQYITKLPHFDETGIVLQIVESNNGKKFHLFRSKAIEESSKNIKLVATINNAIVYQAKIDLTNEFGSNGFIPTRNLPSGILHILAINKDGIPLAERVTFVNNQDYSFNLELENISVNKTAHGFNKIKLIKKDSTWANLSVSVTDADFEKQIPNEDNIISHLLFTGDLKGKIYDPYYYLKNIEDTTIKNLDLVLLTDVWRRHYQKGDTLKKTLKNDFVESNYLTISGRLKSIDYKRLTNLTAVLRTANSTVTLFVLPIDRTGHFFKDGIIFFGNGEIYPTLDKNSADLNASQIEIENGLLPIDSSNVYFNYNELLNPEKQFTNNKDFNNYLLPTNSKTLKEVVINAKRQTKIEVLDKEYTGGLLKGGISKNFNVAEDDRALNNLNIFQYLQDKVAGLQIQNPFSNPSASWRNERVKFFLNNVETEITDIRNIPMVEFEYVKVYDPSQGGAFGASGAVIAIYTKKGKGLKSGVSKPNVKINFNGYSLYQEFYSPDYATSGFYNTTPDIRTTLCWKPNVLMNKETQEYSIEFFNNDFGKNFKIIIEGINSKGKLCHLEKVF
jgi:hypothetical protein